MCTLPNLHKSLELSGWIFCPKKNWNQSKYWKLSPMLLYIQCTSNLFKLFVVFFSLTLGFVGDGFLSFWVLWTSFFSVWCLQGRVCLLVVSYNVDTKCLTFSFQSKYRGSINQYNAKVTSCAHSKPGHRSYIFCSVYLVCREGHANHTLKTTFVYFEKVYC